MTFTYDPTTSAGQVRLLIPDRVLTSYLFEDAEIDTFLALEGDSVKRAAALALETAASDNALVLKVIRLLDLSTDGARTSQALLARAEKLRQQADDEESAEDGGAFDIAEWVVDDFSYRQRLDNEGLRSG
jgi:hypothetical protein